MPHAAYIAIPVLAVAAVATVAIQNRLPERRTSTTEMSKRAQSYLFPARLPDAAALVPPPPAANSEAMKLDLAARETALKFKGTPRYELAKSDANRDPGATVDDFSCALGIDITRERTPTLFNMLTAIQVDARATAGKAKARYGRKRPYVVFGAPSCSLKDEQLMPASYPSARSAVGWADALVLAKLNPARQTQILERGEQFLQSRVICDASWQSDVDAGKMVGTELVKHLFADSKFQTDFKQSQAEFAAVARDSNGSSPRCKAESIALAMR
jgi:acid phosphatase (class A)